MARVCRYNRAIDCDSDECYHCGWDPEVAKARLEDFVRKPYKVPFTGYCEVRAASPEEAIAKASGGDVFSMHFEFDEPIDMEKEEDDEVD
jgi:hypothetical protein